jgi:DNA polymerase-3 subunit gamma/tau
VASAAGAPASREVSPPAVVPAVTSPPSAAETGTTAGPEILDGEPTAAPTGPVTLQRMRDAWPQVLARLESISRSSWLLASGAEVAALEDDVLTLTFQSQTDVAKFKHLSAGTGPSEDLRGAIVAVLGLRVKYIAKHDGERGTNRGADRPADRGSGPRGEAGGTPTPRPGGAAPAEERPAPARASTAPVTEWAVARIPDAAPPAGAGPTASVASLSSSPSSVAQFPIDDEPEDVATDAARLRTTTLAPVREGEILPSADVEPSIEPDEDDSDVEPEVGASIDAPVPPAIVPPLSAPPRDAGRRPQPGSRPGQPQRYGEAVVRQVLGATFIREEPYEPPTRFS